MKQSGQVSGILMALLTLTCARESRVPTDATEKAERSLSSASVVPGAEGEIFGNVYLSGTPLSAKQSPVLCRVAA